MSRADEDTDAREADDRPGASPAERGAYEARIAKLERSRASVDQLVRFQIEAYKARIVDLKQSLAKARAEKRAAERELAALGRRHGELMRQVHELGRRLERAPGSGSEGEQR